MSTSASATNQYAKFSPRDKLATARLAARTRYPYFSSALLNLVPREAPGLGTLGVTEAMILLWDPEAVDRWSLEQLTGVLVHEVGHLLRAHAQRARNVGVVGQDGRALDRNLAKLWNLGCDAEINDDLVAAHPECFNVNGKCPACAAKKCPVHGILPSSFGSPNGLTAEAYFAELRQQAEQQADDGEGGSGSEGDDEPGEGAGDSKNEPGGEPMRGRCGSCAGNPVDGEPAQGDKDGRSEVEVQRVRKEVAEAIKQEAKRGRGNVPAGWARWAEAALTPPKVRWQDKLARTCRNAVAWQAGAVDLTHRKLSRRQWGAGIGPGRPLVHALHAPVPQVAVALDTSGSMGSDELSAALREVKGIMTGIGARVTFAACDAAVHELKQVQDWRELPKLLKGGGGTDFRPAFDALEKQRNRSNILVFITDGDGEAPAEAPAWCRTIWLIVGSHGRSPCEWGEKIFLKD